MSLIELSKRFEQALSQPTSRKGLFEKAAVLTGVAIALEALTASADAFKNVPWVERPVKEYFHPVSVRGEVWEYGNAIRDPGLGGQINLTDRGVINEMWLEGKSARGEIGVDVLTQPAYQQLGADNARFAVWLDNLGQGDEIHFLDNRNGKSVDVPGLTITTDGEFAGYLLQDLSQYSAEYGIRVVRKSGKNDPIQVRFSRLSKDDETKPRSGSVKDVTDVLQRSGSAPVSALAPVLSAPAPEVAAPVIYRPTTAEVRAVTGMALPLPPSDLKPEVPGGMQNVIIDNTLGRGWIHPMSRDGKVWSYDNYYAINGTLKPSGFGNEDFIVLQADDDKDQIIDIAWGRTVFFTDINGKNKDAELASNVKGGPATLYIKGFPFVEYSVYDADTGRFVAKGKASDMGDIGFIGGDCGRRRIVANTPGDMGQQIFVFVGPHNRDWLPLNIIDTRGEVSCSTAPVVPLPRRNVTVPVQLPTALPKTGTGGMAGY